MKVLNFEQGTPEWLASRAGKVTASMIGAVLAAPSTASYRDYQSQLVAEILTGKPQGSDFTNDYMKYGTEMEPMIVKAKNAAKTKFTELVNESA